MATRSCYRRGLIGFAPPPSGRAPEPYRLAPPSPADAEALAQLMLDAYRGTLDDDGETLDEARQEVAGYLAGRDGPPLLACSWLAWSGSQVSGACLAGWWAAREAPLIAYALTRAAEKGHGLGTRLLGLTLAALAADGHPAVWACITDGNHPSEALFRRAGFVLVR